VVGGNTLLPECVGRGSREKILVVVINLFDQGCKPVIVGEEFVPSRSLTGTTTNRRGGVLDATSLGRDRWGIHEGGKGSREGEEPGEGRVL